MDEAVSELKEILLTTACLDPNATKGQHDAIRNFLMKVVQVDDQGQPLSSLHRKQDISPFQLANWYCKRTLVPAIQRVTHAVLHTPFDDGTTGGRGSSMPIEDIRVIYTAIELLWLMVIDPMLTVYMEASVRSVQASKGQPPQNAQPQAALPQRPAMVVVSTPKAMLIDDQIVKELMRNESVTETETETESSTASLMRQRERQRDGFVTSPTSFTWSELEALNECVEDLCTHPLLCTMILPRNIPRFLLTYFVTLQRARASGEREKEKEKEGEKERELKMLRFMSLLTEKETEREKAGETDKETGEREREVPIRRYPSQQLIDKSIIIKSLRHFTNHQVVWIRSLATSYMTRLLLSSQGLMHVILGYLEGKIQLD
jgi:hypothetical protein